MSIFLLWLQLAGATAVILASSNFLAKSADVIAFKTGLGRAFIGVVLLATATSLPELGTGISAIVLFDEPDLAAGEAFGSNLFNLLIIGLLDLFWRNGPILNSVGLTAAVVGALGIAVISLAAIAAVIHGLTPEMSTWHISPVSVVMLVVFLLAMYLIYRFEHSGGQESRVDEADIQDDPEEHEYGSASLYKAGLTYLIAASLIVTAAIWLASTGEKVTDEMGWEASFVGTQFLAFSTSLPELAASFAAIRINAPELAITGVLGSNLFNMGFILFMDDLALVDGPLWDHVSTIHPLTALVAVLMTSVVIFAVLNRGRSRPSKYWTPEALVLIGLYVAASVLVFVLAD